MEDNKETVSTQGQKEQVSDGENEQSCKRRDLKDLMKICWQICREGWW